MVARFDERAAEVLASRGILVSLWGSEAGVGHRVYLGYGLQPLCVPHVGPGKPRRGVDFGDEDIVAQWSSGLHDDFVRIDDRGRTVRHQRIASSGDVGADGISIGRAMSILLASSTIWALARIGGRPLFVGTKSAVAPRPAISLAGSAKFESLQMTMPKVSAPTWKTGISWPASYTEGFM